jgi:hypothetical protein
MRSLILLIAFLIPALSVSAQDLLYLKDWSVVKVKVLKIGESEIEYKRYDNLEGPTYTLRIKDVCRIEFENGSFENYCQKKEKSQDAGPTMREEVMRVHDQVGWVISPSVGFSLPIGDLNKNSDFVGVKAGIGFNWDLDITYFLNTHVGIGVKGGGIHCVSDAGPIVAEINPIPPDLPVPVELDNITFDNGTWSIYYGLAGVHIDLWVDDRNDLDIGILGGFSGVREPMTNAEGAVAIDFGFPIELGFTAENFPDTYSQFAYAIDLNYNIHFTEYLGLRIYAGYFRTDAEITHLINIYPEETGFQPIDDNLQPFPADLDARTYRIRMLSFGVGLLLTP